MDIGEHVIETEDLSIAANAFDELEEIVARFLVQEREALNVPDRRKVVAGQIVDAIVRRLSGVKEPTEVKE